MSHGGAPGDRDPVCRRRHEIRGLVQGVGFRPFVYRLATDLQLGGWVRNTPTGVEIEVEGPPPRLADFARRLRSELPPIARIDEMASRDRLPEHPERFRILHSGGMRREAALLSPDVATCPDCLRELRDPGDRRYRYPFINCTNCGPRFTIVESVPYDRARTSMKAFPMCADCAREYSDPADRRFHAEPDACPACGPQIMLLGPGGEPVEGGLEPPQALDAARDRLARGQVLAVKGLGGFHLACDATNEAAVRRLRTRKGRPHRPLAVMARDLERARHYCRISSWEARDLEGPRRPILLLRQREPTPSAAPPLAPSVAPRHRTLGLMLPYTPLHHLLLEDPAPGLLVMTSGNPSGGPITARNQDAVSVLGGIADALLVHDRDIVQRADDSVAFYEGSRRVLVRRSRGFTPLPLALPESGPPTLALGAMLHTAVALADARRVFLSQHIGDVDDLETERFLREAVERFSRWLDLQPQVVAHDLHPDLPTTHLAHELEREGRVREAVQHHHAHLVAAATAARVEGPVLGLVLDGTGYGPDGTIWGGEILWGDPAGFERLGHQRPLPLPGGDATIRRPLRTAAAWLHACAPDSADTRLQLWDHAEPGELAVIRRMVDRGFRTVPTSSTGRLFDAVSALLGVCHQTTYDGQAAIELEQLALSGDPRAVPRLELSLDREGAGEGTRWILDPAPLLRRLVEALAAGARPPDLAAAFHHALARGWIAAVRAIRRPEQTPAVVLCGGVFYNRILARRVEQGLTDAGYRVVPPGQVPVGDGGLALGQVRVARARQGAASGHPGRHARHP